MGELTGRVALVTGASRGIGAASACALAAAGAKVIVTDVLDTQGVANEIGGLSHKLDVTDEADWIAAIAFAKDKAGGLDILVNNAGVFLMRPVVQMSLEDWRRVQAINVEGVFLGCKHAIPVLTERATKWTGGASIINLSSVAGLKGGSNHVAYAASKGAVRLMSKGLALELAKQRIRVNSVHPGLIETPMGEQVLSDAAARTNTAAEDVRRNLIAAHPLGHAGQPQHIADGIVFLASDRAAFITGTEFVIDGGLSAQ